MSFSHFANCRDANGLGLVRVQFLDGYCYMALTKTRLNQAS